MRRKAFLKLPAGGDLKALRDRALLSLLLYHGLRREELVRLTRKFADAMRDEPATGEPSKPPRRG